MNPDISIIIPVYNVEKYIGQMLDSVKCQTFKNFEVIIVNDGSPDNSQEIIDKFCAKDCRFISFTKENGGVASARNYGLSKAKGRFVVFYDPDDYIPQDALENLYLSITKDNADMAVGAMSIIRAGEYRINGNTLKLSKKRNISKTDTDMLWSFSVCNKMFSRQLIESNNIRFETFKHAEDALFLFECVFKTKNIVGCHAVVYQYMIRPFWEEKSATQIITTTYLLDVINALDSIETIIASSYNEYFIRSFFIRYCEISIIAGYYRQFWALDDSSLEVLQEKISSLKDKMGVEAWRGILNRNLDLQLDESLFTKNHMIENALLTIIVDKENAHDAETFNLFFMSIYDQCMPSFIIKVDKSLDHMIKAQYKNMPNLYFFDAAMCEISTEFVMYADTRILHSKNSIKMMINTLLKDKSLDYVTAPINVYDNGNLSYSIQSIAFTVFQVLKKQSNRRTSADRLDYMTGNKIFRQSSILSYDANNFFKKHLKSKKLINASMIIRGDDNFIMRECIDAPNACYTNIKLFQKKMEDKIIDFIKRHFTKDDVKKLLKRDI